MDKQKKRRKKRKKATYKKLLRTCVFGGYKKKDVRAYIERLEKALAETEMEVLNGKESPHDLPEKRPWITYEVEKRTKEEEFGNVIIFGDVPEN